MFAIVDEIYYQRLSLFTWYAKKYHRSWYARTNVTRKGKTKSLGMHRMIAKTPAGHVPHHKNYNSLDNREENLENMTYKNHNDFHRENHIKLIFEKNSPGSAQ